MEDKKKIVKRLALEYHSSYPAGKLEVTPTKPMTTSQDLSLAYSPGVAEPCLAIAENPALAMQLTGRGNLVAVVTNGTAILGLGNLGPLAAKPVMEGKSVLFKKFADINAFDLEINATDIDEFCTVVSALEPTFGGINLEDVKSPECFEIEKILQKKMNIPVFHDDQHGTAIVASAALINALQLINKKISDITVCSVGVGAAGAAVLEMFIEMGVQRKNIIGLDAEGVLHSGRRNLPEHKSNFVISTSKRTLSDAIAGSDVFLGLSVGDICTPDMVASMAKNPILFCLANPNPEITPDKVLAVRKDAIYASGRSDYPNQVNNVLCFPFLFRGALDVSATSITPGMKRACAQAIAKLARRDVEETVASAYGGEEMQFGKDYILPKPFDTRLVSEISPEVAKAAMEDGVATRPITDLSAYKKELDRIVSRTSQVLTSGLTKNITKGKLKIILSEGEDYRILRASQMIVENGLAIPILVGRRSVIKQYVKRLQLSIIPDKDFIIVDPQDDPRYREYTKYYHDIAGRSGISIQAARILLRTNQTVIGALLLRKGEGDALICGTSGSFQDHLHYIDQLLGKKNGLNNYCSVSVAFLKDKTIFVADTQVNPSPTSAEIVDITELSMGVVRQFGFTPKVALLSHSSFGSSQNPTAKKMRDAVALLHTRYPDYMIDGEMMPDAAFSSSIRSELLENNRLGKDSANLLIMPDIDSASISFRILKATLANKNVIASVLTGCAYPAHIVTKTVSSRSIYNIALFINSTFEEKTANRA